MRLRPIIAFAVLFLFPIHAQAWHNRGHNAVARIAWQKLVDDGLDRRAIEILSAHPHKDLFLLRDRPEGVEADEWMFVQAATWSDWVRRPPIAPGIDEALSKQIVEDYSKPVWHYVNIPYIHPADMARFDEAALRKSVLEPEFDANGNPRHVLAALKYNHRLLNASETSPKDRALALCWILHLAGDLHQPMHAVGLIASRDTLKTQEFLIPSGDQGGNRVAIRTSENDPGSMALHFFWDRQVLADLPYATVQSRVHDWLHDAAFARSTYGDAFKKNEFVDWAEESRALAKEAAYRDGDQFLRFIPMPEKYMRSELDSLAAPVVSEQYQKRADAIAQRRLVLAGYRLGDLLASSFKPSP